MSRQLFHKFTVDPLRKYTCCVLNGVRRKNKLSWNEKVLWNNATTRIAIDGGITAVEKSAKAKAVDKIFCGDGDSGIFNYDSSVEMISDENQNFTDFDKCMNHLAKTEQESPVMLKFWKTIQKLV